MNRLLPSSSSSPGLLALALSLPLAACGGLVEPEPPPCEDTPPSCVVPSLSCAPSASAAPTCDESTHAWSCPAGSTSYAPVAAPASACLPFHTAGGPVSMLGGSLVRVPVDGGRCLWVGETVTTTDGQEVRDVGFVADPDEAFGSCPTKATFAGGSLASAVTIEGTDDPTLTVQIDGGFLFHGETRVLYRLFQSDASATFGVTELGGGMGTWDAASQKIVVPGPDALAFGTDIDLGDASLAMGDDVYIWGCHAPIQFLTEPCALARLAPTGLDYLGTNGSSISAASVDETATVFSGGPWIASVVPAGGGQLLHVYAVGFGSTLETDTAAQATGPWTAGPTLAQCDSPADDPHAFCAGPVVHEELADPAAAGQLVVSYGVGTTASGASASKDPDAYWTRLVWVTP